MVDIDKQTTLTRVLQLPRELRDIIWAHVLLGPVKINLLRINRQIHEEATSVLYRIKTARICTPEDFRIFAAAGMNNGRNKALRYLELAIDCLYINDHTRPGRSEQETMFWQKGKELEVNRRLRAWGAIFSEWESFGFTSLRLVHILFRQFAFYFLRIWGPFTDPTEFWRLINTLSSSALVCGGTEDIQQSGLFTAGACRAFELLVEKKCAIESIAQKYEAGPESYPSSFSIRDRYRREIIAKVRRRNALTQLELMHYTAYCLKIQLHPDDTLRLEKLRQLEREKNDGIAINYATQANLFRTAQSLWRWSSLSILVKSVVPHSSLYLVWDFYDGTSPGWNWVDEIRSPTRKWGSRPNRLDIAPSNPLFPATFHNSTDEEALCSEILATSTTFDPDFALLIDTDSWRAHIDEAAQSTLYCLCSACETAATNGQPVVHTSKDT